MKVVIDKYIPFIQGVIEPFAEVQYLEPEQFTPAAVRDADALLVRTATRCDAALLSGSKVRAIATATIGFDHIDTAYCENHHILWTASAGCNAQGVCDYVESGLRLLQGKVLGIVGVGHVGSLVEQMAKRKGYTVLLNDPPRAEKEGNKEIFTSLEDIARQADIITFHTPLTKAGEYATYHLLDEQLLSLCKPTVSIINAARGGVVDEHALLTFLNTHSAANAVIDTWEGEPRLNTDLLERVLIGTYHIAGYTVRGKQNATRMCLEFLREHFPELQQMQIPAFQQNPQPLQDDWLQQVDRQLRGTPDDFTQLRRTYKLR